MQKGGKRILKNMKEHEDGNWRLVLKVGLSIPFDFTIRLFGLIFIE